MATYKTIQRTGILSFLETNSEQAFTVKEIIEGIRSASAVGWDHERSCKKWHRPT